MKNITHIYRHGDWLLEAVKDIAKDAQEVTKDALGKTASTSFTFGVGDATGHNHVAIVNDITKMKWYRASDGGWYVSLSEEAKLTHPEHSMVKDLVIAPGTYRVRQAKERDWFSLTTRRVID